jgi:hypothetical protein
MLSKQKANPSNPSSLSSYSRTPTFSHTTTPSPTPIKIKSGAVDLSSLCNARKMVFAFNVVQQTTGQITVLPSLWLLKVVSEVEVMDVTVKDRITFVQFIQEQIRRTILPRTIKAHRTFINHRVSRS